MTKTIEQNVDTVTQANAASNENLVEFHKPYTFESQEYRSIDLSSLSELTSQDLINTDRIFSTSGGFAMVPETNLEYLLLVAATATKKPQEFFSGLPAKDALKVKNKVMGFLNN